MKIINICLYENIGYEKSIALIRTFLYKFTLMNNIKFYLKKYSWMDTWSKKYSSRWKIFKNIQDAFLESDIIISIGGDGTLLSCATEILKILKECNNYKELPILGINTGNLGFLATYNKLPYQIITDILENNYKIIDRTVLQLNNDEIALNEIVIKNSDYKKMVNLDIYIDDIYVGNYLSDGIIISTPTGSTAYSLSSGGPIISGNSKVFCITPISPHSLTFRPLIIPDNSIIKIKPKTNIVTIYDGHNNITKKNSIIPIKINKYMRTVKLIKPIEDNYYNILREKLLWTEKGK